MNTISMLGLPFLACLLLSLVLSYLGLHVLKREIIFIDIAFAQIAALGALSAHLFLNVPGDSIRAFLSGAGATFLAALFFAVARRKATQLPIEAVIGITYAVSAAGALFLIGKSACGHTHIQTMLSGALLWVKPSDLLWSGIVFAVLSSCFLLFRKSFQRISDGYEQAVAAGTNVIAWDFLFYALGGVAITLAVHLAGVVVTFCFLIIPATVSALFSKQWKFRFLIAFLTSSAGSAAGLLFARWLDFSAGVSVSLFLGVFLLACLLAIRIRDVLLRDKT